MVGHGSSLSISFRITSLAPGLLITAVKQSWRIRVNASRECTKIDHMATKQKTAKPKTCVYLWHTQLTHWGRETHICVSKLTVIGLDNGLSPGRRQVIIWTNDGILLIWPLLTYFSEILIEIPIFSFKKMQLKMSSAKCRPFCLGLNVLNVYPWNGSTVLYVFVLLWSAQFGGFAKDPGPVSITQNASYCKISRSLDAARSVV